MHLGLARAELNKFHLFTAQPPFSDQDLDVNFANLR
jgi:hypothetical protein